MPRRVTRTKSSGKRPARPKATKAKAAADAADEPKQTATKSRRTATRARAAQAAPDVPTPQAAAPVVHEPLAAYEPPPAYVPPMMPPGHVAQGPRRRSVFFDVENTSRTQDIEKVLAHLDIDFTRGGVEFMAVGNWRVIGHEPARILAAKGAHLIHSAPTTGVRDWSDLRIAVAAGVWIATAQPGDVLEIVSDDQAFEAVGDVAAGRGIIFRRVSYRRLAGLPVTSAPPSEYAPEPANRSRRGGRRSGRRGRGGRSVGHAGHAGPSHAHAPARPAPAARDTRDEAPPAGDAVQTAPLDELLDVLHALLARAPQGITLDMLANALKARGFRRRPGSPRLITRLKLIKDIVIDRAGNIRLADGANGLGGPVRIIADDQPVAALPIEPDDEESGGDYDEADDVADEPGADEPMDAGQEAGEPGAAGPQNGRRRRRRRGGRRRRGRRGGGGAPVEAAAAPS